MSTFDPHKSAAAGVLLAAATIAAGFFVCTISGGYPPQNSPWLLAHSFSLSHAVDDTAAICSIMPFSAVAAFIIAINLFGRCPLTGASSVPEIFAGGQPAESVRQRRSNDGFYNAIAFSN